MSLDKIKNWIIKRLSGYTLDEIANVFARNLILNVKLTGEKELNELLREKGRRYSAKLAENNKKSIESYNKLYSENKHLHTELDILRKDIVVQRKGYGKLRTRKLRMLNFIKTIDKHSLYNKTSIIILGKMLRGEKINDKK